MRVEKWTQRVCGELRRVNAGHRALAGLLILMMTVGLVSFSLPVASAADTDYQAEQEAREAEYNRKFDMDTLTWKTNGTDDQGKTVNYGGSARNYLYWADGNFGGVAYKKITSTSTPLRATPSALAPTFSIPN